MIGLSRSSACVGVESGRPDWSMQMVGGDDVGCRSGEFLSCFVVSGVVLYFWDF